MSNATLSLHEKKWTAAARKAHKAKGGYFAGDNMTFPLDDASDVADAWGLAGHAPNPDQVRANIKRWAKANGHYDALPATAKAEDDKPKESALSPSLHPAFNPKSRIATFKTCFTRDGARSRNFGRTYTREANDALLRSGQVALSTPNADPLTCYVNHTSADNDQTLHIAGKIIKLWRERDEGWAMLEMPDTTSARDAAVLVKNGYLKTSLRASNAKYHLDKDTGAIMIDSAVLEGIDFTTTPGLETATTDVLLESTDAPFSDIFDLPSSTLLIASEEGPPMLQAQLSLDDALKEAYSLGGDNTASNPRTSGDSPYMTDDPTTDDYGKRMFPVPPKGDPMLGVHPSGSLENGLDGVVPDITGVQEAHDRIATVQGRPCAPASMESHARRTLTEAGRKLSADTHRHLDKAHDALAGHLGLACEGQARDAIDPDHDGDDDRTNDPAKNPDWQQDKANSMESRRPASTPTPWRVGTTQLKETRKPMSMEEAARLLEQAGYKIDRPKTETEKLQEAFDAKLEAKLTEQASRFEEQMKTLLAGIAPQQPVSETPQRKSLVVGANAHTSSQLAERGIYTNGAYLKEKMHNLSWEELADRTAPLPKGINLKWLLEEFKQLRVAQYFNRHGWPDED